MKMQLAAIDSSRGNRQECQPSCLQVAFCSVVGAAIFEWSWMQTGGGYHCSIPVFLALFSYCYGRQLLSPSIFRMLARNVCTNVRCMLKEEKLSVVLMVSYFSIKFGLAVLYPAGEKSNGSPISLIAFTVLFITIFLMPFMYRIICGLLLRCRSLLNAGKVVKASLTTSEKPKPFYSRETLLFYLRVLKKWRKSILICAVLVLISYMFDSNITALVRFLGTGKPCWPLLIPSRSKAASIPVSVLNAYPWHTVYPTYHPSLLLKAFIHVGRELGEVCHLLPMLIGTYSLSQLLLPPENSIIKKALFASIAGVVLGGVTSGSFKIMFHRYRPNAYGDPYMWKGPSMTTVNHLSFSKLDLSFPAGHTTVTSAVATCWYAFSLLNCKQLCVSPFANLFFLLCFYVNPLLVLLSRVSECFHWTSDATFGVSFV